MDGSIYLQIAEGGLSMPLAVDLVLHEEATRPRRRTNRRQR